MTKAPTGSRTFSHNVDSVISEPCHQNALVQITLIQGSVGEATALL